MIRTAALAAAAALIAAAPLSAAAAPVQTPVQTPAQPGLSIEAVRAWLTANGGVVSPVNRTGGETWISVNDDPLTWMIFFYGCQGDVCGDIQYAASFSNPTITQAMVNDWNRDQRFLKAFFVAGEPGGDNTAMVQYDVLAQPGGVEQLNDHTAVWLSLLAGFATKVGYFAPAQ